MLFFLPVGDTIMQFDSHEIHMNIPRKSLDILQHTDRNVLFIIYICLKYMCFM